MVEIKRLTSDVSVSRQPAREDFAALKAAGFRSVINNRMASELEPAPGAEEEKGLAEAQGLAYAHLPVQGGDLTDANVIAAFGELLDSLPKPILAHCAGGTRSAVLWAMANAGRLPVGEILATTAAAGYDLSRFLGAIEDRASRARREDGTAPAHPASASPAA